jgi:hypothetical protein
MGIAKLLVEMSDEQSHAVLFLFQSQLRVSPQMWPNGVGNAKKRGIWRMIDGKQGIERNKNEGRLDVWELRSFWWR